MPPKQSAGVPAIRRALAVFDLLASVKRGLNVSEISRKLSLPKSSTHRILTTLELEQCVYRSAETGRYYFGIKLFGLNKAALEGLELREEAKASLVSLMQRTGLTVHMAVLEHNQAVLVEKLEPAGQPTVGTWIGRAMDVNSTGAGKALVAFLPPAEFARRVVAGRFVRHNAKTIVSIDRLKQELAKVRELGYAVDNEEDELGVRCIGCPVFYSDRVIAAISVVGTTEQIPEDSIPPLAEMVKQTAASISSRLGSSASLLPEKLLRTDE